MMNNKQQLLMASLFIFSSMVMANEPVDQSIEDLIVGESISKNRLEVQINEVFKAHYLTSDFFADYEDEDVDLTKLDRSLVLMPFLCNVVTIVWISGKKYAIDSLDEDLYHSFQTIKKVFQRLYPKTSWDGEIVPRKIVKNYAPATLKDSKKEIALLYSAGLDSTASSFNHLDKKQLLITACGQWDIPLKDPELWKRGKRI